MLMRGRPVPDCFVGDRPCAGAALPVGDVAHGSEVHRRIPDSVFGEVM